MVAGVFVALPAPPEILSDSAKANPSPLEWLIIYSFP